MLGIKTTMSTAVLIERVSANREQHQKHYREAVEAFWVQLDGFLSNLAERARKKDEVFLRLADSRNFGGIGDYLPLVASLAGLGSGAPLPAPPRCYMGTYDQALDMLKSHQEQSVTLDAHDFARLVRDEWEWKQDFVGSYSTLMGHAPAPCGF